MEESQKAGFNRLESSGYLPVLRELVRSHAAPIWWWDDSQKDACVAHSGTITFVGVGQRTLGITANHVVQAYLRDKAANAEIKCQIGSVRVELENYIACTLPALDLAAIELSPILLPATRALVHAPAVWPVEALEEDELVIMGGYPGDRRVEHAQALTTDFVAFIGRVSSASETHAAVLLNLQHSYWPQGVSLGHDPDLGGMSGGPVFRLRTNPIESLEFAGVIYESSRTFEIVRARHASLLEGAFGAVAA